MIDHPQTLADARNYRYHRWAGNPNGRRYVETDCAYEVWDNMMAYQCSRKNGHGATRLYCKQHARMVEKKHA